MAGSWIAVFGHTETVSLVQRTLFRKHNPSDSYLLIIRFLNEVEINSDCECVRTCKQVSVCVLEIVRKSRKLHKFVNKELMKSVSCVILRQSIRILCRYERAWWHQGPPTGPVLFFPAAGRNIRGLHRCILRVPMKADASTVTGRSS